jgi:hypothetical protein
MQSAPWNPIIPFSKIRKQANGASRDTRGKVKEPKVGQRVVKHGIVSRDTTGTIIGTGKVELKQKQPTLIVRKVVAERKPVEPVKAPTVGAVTQLHLWEFIAFLQSCGGFWVCDDL